MRRVLVLTSLCLTLLVAEPAAAVSILERETDAGDLPSNAQQIVTQQAERLTSITGVLRSPTDVDMYLFRAAPNFTIQTRAPFDTQLFLFTAGGRGISANDDDPRGGLTSRLTSGGCAQCFGMFYVAISQFNIDPVNAAGTRIFPDFPFNQEQRPVTGQSARALLHGWAGTPLSFTDVTVDLPFGAGQ